MNLQLLNTNTIIKTISDNSLDITKHNSNINKQIVDEISSNNLNGINMQDDLKKLNHIINNTSKTKYKIVKYLGKGIQGNLFLAVNGNNKYILKQIKLDPRKNFNTEQSKQLNFELNILKYLSNNQTTREYVNPCLEHLIHENMIYTIFPIFNGYSLVHFYNYLSRMKATEYYKILFFLIKSVLLSLSRIHETNIAHQNINENSILVSTFIDPCDIKVKFTDFGLGCGYNSRSGDARLIDVEEYNNDAFFKIATCQNNNHVPVKIDDNILSQLKDSDYLAISQKWDLLCLGLIFIKYLLYFDNYEINSRTPYNRTRVDAIRNAIMKKYLSQSNSTIKQAIVNKIDSLIISKDIKRDILEYLKLILTYVLCPTTKRQSAQYLLDKIIIYEKYKNDVF